MIGIAEAVKLLGAGGSSALASLGVTYMLFTPADDFNRHLAQDRTGTILELVEKLKHSEMPDDVRGLLCETLQTEIASLCLEAESHPFCAVEARASLIREARC